MSRNPAAVTVTSLWGSRLILHCANNPSLTDDEFYKQQNTTFNLITSGNTARQKIKLCGLTSNNFFISFPEASNECLCIKPYRSIFRDTDNLRWMQFGVKVNVHHVRVEREVLMRWWTGGDDTWNITVRARRLWREKDMRNRRHTVYCKSLNHIKIRSHTQHWH